MSLYEREPGVPAPKIGAYPKRRRDEINGVHLSARDDGGPAYADFFVQIPVSAREPELLATA